MKLIRGLWRLPRLLYLVGWGLASGDARHLRALRATPPDPEAQGKNREWFQRILACLNIQVSVTGEPADAPCLVVCNHVSWLDILVLGQSMPVAFLSKAEVARWPMISRLARAGGTLFIKRGGEGAARRSIEQIRKAFKRKQNIAIFPEGTTGKGRTVMPFHPRLFAAAIESGVPVQPVALRYPHPEGVHPKAPYVGDQPLVSNLLGILGCADIRVEVFIGPAINPENSDRRHLADRAREFVVGVVEREAGAPMKHEGRGPGGARRGVRRRGF